MSLLSPVLSLRFSMVENLFSATFSPSALNNIALPHSTLPRWHGESAIVKKTLVQMRISISQHPRFRADSLSDFAKYSTFNVVKRFSFKVHTKLIINNLGSEERKRNFYSANRTPNNIRYEIYLRLVHYTPCWKVCRVFEVILHMQNSDCFACVQLTS